MRRARREAAAAGDGDASLRRTLALCLAGGAANAAWLLGTAGEGPSLAGVLSGVGLACCAVPALLCARRLARRRR